MMSEKRIVLKSSDGECIEVDEAVAIKSKTIADIIEENGAGEAIPIPNIKSNILKLVIEYCEKHIESDDSLTDESKEVFNKWDSEFLKMEQSTLFPVIQAANYLNIRDLLDLSCRTVADMMRDKTPKQIRAHFNIKNDLTKGEEEEIVKENPWAFDD